jgi:hypothetical protein
VSKGREIVARAPRRRGACATLRTSARRAFLVHEECPAEVARETLAFLGRVTQPSVALA